MLASAGRVEGNQGFEIRELSRHASFYVRLLRAFCDARLPIRIAVSDFGSPDRNVHLEEQILGPLRASLSVECCLDPNRPSGRGYYRDLCMKIDAQTSRGEWIEWLTAVPSIGVSACSAIPRNAWSQLA